MSYKTAANIEDIYREGKEYHWHRPRCKCGAKVHGHGFVTRYFNCFKEHLFIKKWRCPKCGAVITARPSGYWPRFQESIKTIFETIKSRIKNYKWPPWTKRQRAGHWLNKLLVNAKLHNLMKESVLDTIIFYQGNNLHIN
jgi:hypothetical protein